ncbi:hypothetical protein [Nocardioides halotolerans]|uniref:hypothetical protein n=1 Tax=Nocardioides halotolerans TaxID=433660 RepID=UPI0003FA1EEF|nr:hypothetical protein [Nocardioides halotolerans]
MTGPKGLVARLAVVLATATAGLGIVAGSPAPATAAACSGATGVTVVVDHGALGGGVDQVCVTSGGQDGASLFASAGFSLTYVQRQPGFVCRIDGQPASDPCVNTPPSNAYWGLWWSDGRSGSWSYSSLAAGALSIPSGGYVAFAWQTGSSNPPGVPPAPHASTPTAAPSTTAPPGGGGSGGGSGGGHGQGGGNGGGSGGGNGGGSGAHASPTPTAPPSGRPSASSAATPTVAPTQSAVPTSATRSASEEPTPTGSPATTSAPSSPSETAPADATASPSEVAAPTASEPPDDAATSGTLPGWAVLLVLLALAGGSAAAYVLRGRGRTSP